MEELNLNQLEVGEWYEMGSNNTWKGWFHKHKEIASGDEAVASELCQLEAGGVLKKQTYTWCSGYTFRKATKEQLKSFLPKDHPDCPIENSDYKWLLILQENIDRTDFEKGAIAEIDRLNGNSFRMKRFGYDIMLSGLAEGKIKPFLTKEDAEKYWDSINVKPVETPKAKQLSDLKKGDWVKFIFDFGTSNFKENNLYKLTRDWDNGDALIIDDNGNSNGFGNRNIANFTVPTQQEIETWEKSLIKDEPKEFVLPEKWCIKVLGGSKDNPEIYQWRLKNSPYGGNWESDGYLNEIGYHSPNKPDACPEITLEQFEKYVLKSKIIVEDKPKEDMKTIPKYWYIENKYQEVRDYLADTYNESCIKNWTFDFIGWDESPCHKGCHGFRSADEYAAEATKITIEQFREYFLKKPKEVPQDDKYSILKEGEYYTCFGKHDKDKKVVFRFKSMGDDNFIQTQFHLVTGIERVFRKDSRINDLHQADLRKATQDEIDWLDDCIKAGKFIEEFPKFHRVITETNKTPQDDYSWWYELEAGDVIESLTDCKPSRNKGEKFTVLENDKGYVSYTNLCSSYAKEEWKLISKAKDKVKEHSTHRIETTITTSPNWYETSINDKPIAQFCPQPEETEIVPISKYFKIRN